MYLDCFRTDTWPKPSTSIDLITDKLELLLIAGASAIQLHESFLINYKLLLIMTKSLNCFQNYFRKSFLSLGLNVRGNILNQLRPR